MTMAHSSEITDLGRRADGGTWWPRGSPQEEGVVATATATVAVDGLVVAEGLVASAAELAEEGALAVC